MCDATFCRSTSYTLSHSSTLFLILLQYFSFFYTLSHSSTCFGPLRNSARPPHSVGHLSLLNHRLYSSFLLQFLFLVIACTHAYSIIHIFIEDYSNNLASSLPKLLLLADPSLVRVQHIPSALYKSPTAMVRREISELAVYSNPLSHNKL